MPKVIGFGHIGIFVKDMEVMSEFYSKFLGLTITDVSDDGRLIFLSTRPEEEHHELLLVRNPDVKNSFEHFSFKVGSLADLKTFYGKIRERDYKITRRFNHGNALGCYFLDPEGNQIEVYWSTGLDVAQPTADNIDFTLPEAEILDILHKMPKRKLGDRPNAVPAI